MTQVEKLLSLEDRVKLVANDILESVRLTGRTHLVEYAMSKQLADYISPIEFKHILNRLHKSGHITAPIDNKKMWNKATNIAPDSFDFRVRVDKIQKALAQKQPTYTEPYEFIKNRAELRIGEHHVILRHATLQFFIVQECIKKPDARVQETDIMAKYETDYELTGSNRSIRDAVRSLNAKIIRSTDIYRLFIYSRGYVVFDTTKLEN